jgi:hypothetical protein
LAACAVAFGVWATLTKNSATFGRQTGLAGVYSLVLAVVVTAFAMIGWAARRGSQGSSPASNKGTVESAGDVTETREADHGSTYIEMHGGSLVIPAPQERQEVPPVNTGELDGPGLLDSYPARNSPSLTEERRLFIRATRITRSGESQEIEIFDAEVADLWIRSDPWGQPHSTGATDDE